MNGALLPLFVAFFLGILIGTLTGCISAAPALEGIVREGISLASLLWLPLLAAILGTSTMGYKLIPLLMFLRAYLLSASFTIMLGSKLAAGEVLLRIGLPALFSVPAFFLLCEEAASLSRILCLCSESSLVRKCGYIQPLRLLVVLALLSASAAVQIYILPRIV